MVTVGSNLSFLQEDTQREKNERLDFLGHLLLKKKNRIKLFLCIYSMWVCAYGRRRGATSAYAQICLLVPLQKNTIFKPNLTTVCLCCCVRWTVLCCAVLYGNWQQYHIERLAQGDVYALQFHANKATEALHRHILDCQSKHSGEKLFVQLHVTLQ